jgi:hypothetical protein
MRGLLFSILAAALLATTFQKPLGSTPVVVELYTSQGCSSCPPADALISQLAHQRGQVIPLAFHVDYWDHLGWRDPFSSKLWTQRQMMYVRSFHLNSAYTPQMVVNGSRQFIGSNASAMNAAVEEASRVKPVGNVAVDVARRDSKINTTIRVEAPQNSDIVLIVFENNVPTRIERGENEGRSATDDAIVRRIVRVGTGSLTKTLSVDADPSWKQLGVVVFVQDRATLAITAATARPVGM